MSNPADFIIENGVLTKYVGPGGDVEIPEGVAVIGAFAFQNKRFVTSISLPNSVVAIERDAFMRCSDIKRVTLPDGISEIGDRAFFGCHGLQQITIPRSVRKIGVDAFHPIRTLRSFTFFSEESFLVAWRALREHRTYILLSLIKEKRLFPASIPKIKAERGHLSELMIAEDDSEGMATLFSLFKRIDLDELDLAIKKSEDAPLVKAYLIEYKNQKYPCEKQEKMAQLGEEKELGLRPRSIADWKKIYGFRKCEGGLAITDYKGKGSLAEIPEYLGKDPIVRIDAMTFFACRDLTAVTIPDRVKTIGRGAFRDCKGLADENGFVIVRRVLYSYHGTESDVAVPDGVECISYNAFSECGTLVSVTIPRGVTKIDMEAFWDCPFLETVTIPDSVTEIGRLALHACPKLTIHAPACSYAETYAKENNIPFVAE